MRETSYSMATINQFSAKKLLDPANEQFAGQGRVNAEIFTAMEILGRKLERSESERDRLTRRLALIESAAALDEKTGKLYLPVVVDPAQPQRGMDRAAAKGMTALSLMSAMIALFAIGIVLFRDPAPALTKEQLAALDSLKAPQAALPDTAGSAGQEQAAEMPQPVEAPVVAAAAPEAPPPSAGKAPDVQSVAAAATAPVSDKPAAEKTQSEEPPVVLSRDEMAVSPPEETAEAGLSPDPELPAKLAQLEKRAYQGVPEAQHDIGALYASGKLAPQNYQRAVYWFGKAADGGVANAHYNLGVIYQQGLGVKPDMQKAIAWYEKAAELGHPEALYNLGIVFIEGVGTKPDVGKGVSYLKRAANAGVAQAAYNLGVLYESNFIGAIDTAKALEWYQVAAHAGHAEARAAISRLKGPEDPASTPAGTAAGGE